VLFLPVRRNRRKTDAFSSGLDIFNLPPTMLPINCAGPRHVLLRDLDGTLTGTGTPNSTILGGYTQQRHPSGYDTGALVLPGPCSDKSGWGGYLCVLGVAVSGLVNGWTPNPMPPAGEKISKFPVRFWTSKDKLDLSLVSFHVCLWI
jgi:hypothetical protein